MVDGGDGVVGSLDFPPPTQQTFGHIHVWTQLYPFVHELVHDTDTIAKQWWDAAEALERRVKDLNDIHDGFKDTLGRLEGVLEGTAGEALQAKGEQLATHMRDLANTASKYPLPVGNVGHDIKVYATEFWNTYRLYHKLTEIEEDRFEAWAHKLYIDAGVSEGAPADMVAKARNAAYQMVEQNLMIPDQRAWLVHLASKYVSKEAELEPLTLELQTFNTISGSGSGSGSGGGSGSGSADDSESSGGKDEEEVAGGNGSGDSNERTPPQKGKQMFALAPGPIKEAKEDANNGSGAPLGAGSDSGQPVGQTPAPGGGMSPERRQALADAEKAAQDGINALRKPGDSPERTKALDDAEQAVKDAFDALEEQPSPGNDVAAGPDPQQAALQEAQDAIDKTFDDLLSGAAPGSPGSSGDGKSPGSPSSPGPGKSAPRTPMTSLDPDAQDERTKALLDAQNEAKKAIDGLLPRGTSSPGGSGPGGGSDQPPTGSDGPDSPRAEALDEAQKAAHDAIQDVIDKNKLGGGDPAENAIRDNALHDAQDAVDKAFDDLETKPDAGSDLQARDEALNDAKDAVDKVFDDLEKKSDGGSDPQARSKALQDAQYAVDKAFDDLEKKPAAGSGSQVRDEALKDARHAVDKAFDDLLEEGADAKPGSGSGRSDPNPARQDALQDAQEAVEEAIDDLIGSAPDPEANTPAVIQDDAFGDAKDAVDKKLDAMIEETRRHPTVSAPDRQSRIDALIDAKRATDNALDDLINEDGVVSDLSAKSTLSDFLSGSGSGTGSGSGGGGSPLPGATAPQVQLGVGTSSQELPAGSGTAPMTFDGAALAAAQQGQGMPMAPPMGGMGMGGAQPRDRDRSTWIVADEGLWDDEEDAASSTAVGRKPT